MIEEKLAVIIPTKDRVDKLVQLLKSILAQEIKPRQIIIVDGGVISADSVVSMCAGLIFDYVRSPSDLAGQRNIGIKLLRETISFVAFFDDDIVLEKDSLKNMMRFWKFAPPDAGGASFNNISDTYKRPSLLERIFLVNSDKPGKIMHSGFQSKICSLEKTTCVDWLLGGLTVWRREVFKENVFDEWYSGYAHCEDVDFSYRIGKKYRLFVVADAKVMHNSNHKNKTESFSLGVMQVKNRLYFVKKNPELSRLLCYWALFGLFINNCLRGIFRASFRHINAARGNLVGFIETLLWQTYAKERKYNLYL